MSKTTPKIFISYARIDGKEIADRLRKRLELEKYPIPVWQDLTQLEGGKGWWNQITDALDEIEFLILIMTPGALESKYTRMEWQYARQRGVCVYPVTEYGCSSLNLSNIPKWMSKSHIFNLNDEWQKFVNFITNPCNALRVPFMAPEIPVGYVERKEQYKEIKRLILDQDNPAVINTSMCGPGGFGKTTLAIALCHDDDVLSAYDDGILWVRVGEEELVMEGLIKIYAALTGNRPAFVDKEDAAFHVREKLEKKCCLIVIDDVWDASALKYFLLRRTKSTFLITTRTHEVASHPGMSTRYVELNEMKQSESTELLINSIKPHVPTVSKDQFYELTDSLGDWPLLLTLAASYLRGRVLKGTKIDDAIERLSIQLQKKGIHFLDPQKNKERNQAISTTMDLSLGELNEEDKNKYYVLAIFPGDTVIHLSTLSALWGIDENDTEDFVVTFDNLSLLKYDPATESIRMLGIIQRYLEEQKLQNEKQIHNQLLDGWGDFHNLPDSYAWNWISYHLYSAGRGDELKKLLTSFNWIHSKLKTTNTNALLNDFKYLPVCIETEIIQQAIRLSAHVGIENQGNFAGQMLGRLISRKESIIREMLSEACETTYPSTWIKPCSQSLTPPGGPLMGTLAGHSQSVNAVKIVDKTQKEQLVVSSSDDGTIKVWDLASGLEKLSIKSRADIVKDIAITPNQKRIISASNEGVLKLWNMKNGKKITDFSGHEGIVNSVTVSPDESMIVSSSTDKTVKIWDIENRKEVIVFKGHTDSVNEAIVSSDSKRIFSASDDNTIKCFDIKTGKTVNTYLGHKSLVKSIAISSNDKLLLSASSDNTLKLWDIAKGEKLKTLRGHRLDVLTVKFIPGTNNEKAISGSHDKTLKIWDLKSGKEIMSLPGHTASVTEVSVAKNGKVAVSSSNDRTVKVWDLEAGKEIERTCNHKGEVTGLNFSKNSEFFISCSKDKTIKRWCLEGFKNEKTFTGDTGPITSVAIGFNPIRLISGTEDGSIKFWDIDRGEEVLSLNGHKKNVKSLVIIQDTDYFISASADKTLKLWNKEGDLIRNFTGHTGGINSLYVLSETGKLISASDDKTIIIWDIRSGDILNKLEGHSYWVTALAVTHDKKLIISASADATLKVWDLAKGCELNTFKDHLHRVNDVAVTPCGSYAISASYDATLKQWDLKKGRIVKTFHGHTAEVLRLKVTPDGNRLISISNDASLKIWDIESGNLLCSFIGEGPLVSCAYKNNGNLIITGESTGRVHILHVEGFE